MPGAYRHVGSGFGIGLQPLDHQIEVLLAPQERLAAAGEQHAAVVGVDRLARRPDALDRELVLEQRDWPHRRWESSIESPATPVLTPRATLTATLSGLDRKAALEVRVDGNIDRRAHRGQVIADVIDGDAVVGLGDGPGEDPRWSRPAP